MAPDADACVGTSPARAPTTAPRVARPSRAREEREALPERARRRPGGVVSFSPQNSRAAFRFLLTVVAFVVVADASAEDARTIAD